ncbi:MAG: AAA family ATPase [Candidatus Heimdallarchaeota archaeon]|nr:AAA family ATPase [Candidatus Heimdallarchaeota archaeon]
MEGKILFKRIHLRNDPKHSFVNYKEECTSLFGEIIVVVITISGPHGAGKSTYAKAIAKELSLRYVSSGQQFRRLAKEEGLSLEDFSNVCEQDEDIDRKIDQLTIKEAKKGNVILEGQLAAWMTRDFSDFNIYVTATFETRVNRIAERDDKDYAEARQETTSRKKSEVQRFKELYNIDIENLDIYDMILSTERLSREVCINILVAACKEIKENSK